MRRILHVLGIAFGLTLSLVGGEIALANESASPSADDSPVTVTASTTDRATSHEPGDKIKQHNEIEVEVSADAGRDTHASNEIVIDATAKGVVSIDIVATTITVNRDAGRTNAAFPTHVPYTMNAEPSRAAEAGAHADLAADGVDGATDAGCDAGCNRAASTLDAADGAPDSDARIDFGVDTSVDVAGNSHTGGDCAAGCGDDSATTSNEIVTDATFGVAMVIALDGDTESRSTADLPSSTPSGATDPVTLNDNPQGTCIAECTDAAPVVLDPESSASDTCSSNCNSIDDPAGVDGEADTETDSEVHLDVDTSRGCVSNCGDTTTKPTEGDMDVGTDGEPVADGDPAVADPTMVDDVAASVEDQAEGQEDLDTTDTEAGQIDQNEPDGICPNHQSEPSADTGPPVEDTHATAEVAQAPDGGAVDPVVPSTEPVAAPVTDETDVTEPATHPVGPDIVGIAEPVDDVLTASKPVLWPRQPVAESTGVAEMRERDDAPDTVAGIASDRPARIGHDGQPAGNDRAAARMLASSGVLPLRAAGTLPATGAPGSLANLVVPGTPDGWNNWLSLGLLAMLIAVLVALWSLNRGPQPLAAQSVSSTTSSRMLPTLRPHRTGPIAAAVSRQPSSDTTEEVDHKSGPSGSAAAAPASAIEIEQLLESIGARYVADLRQLYTEFERVFAAQLAAKDAALIERERDHEAQIAAKDAQLVDLEWRLERIAAQRNELAARVKDLEQIRVRHAAELQAVSAEISQRLSVAAEAIGARLADPTRMKGAPEPASTGSGTRSPGGRRAKQRSSRTSKY